MTKGRKPSWIERIDKIVLPGSLEMLMLIIAYNCSLNIRGGPEEDEIGEV